MTDWAKEFGQRFADDMKAAEAELEVERRENAAATMRLRPAVGYTFDDLVGHGKINPAMVCKIAPSRWERFVTWLKVKFGVR